MCRPLRLPCESDDTWSCPELPPPAPPQVPMPPTPPPPPAPPPTPYADCVENYAACVEGTFERPFLKCCKPQGTVQYGCFKKTVLHTALARALQFLSSSSPHLSLLPS